MSAEKDNKIELVLPDGSRREYPAGTTGARVAADIGKRLARDAVAVKLNGEVYDLLRPLKLGGEFAVLTLKDRDGRTSPEALRVLRHSAAHVTAEAIMRLWPQAKLVYGPALDDGFYYDIDLDEKIGAGDFPRIEAEIEKITAADKPFTRVELSREAGLARVRAEGNPYKLDNAERAAGEALSFYVTGTPGGADFEDLCRGPHLPSTGRVGAVKITSVAGAYWRGDATQKQLQRVYGTAFPTKKELEDYLAMLEEAKKRDHRVLGKKLGLFLLDPVVGQGLPLWLPKGAIVRMQLQDFLREELFKRGYQPVYTPHLGRLELYRTSGHYPYFKDDQFPPLRFPAGAAKSDGGKPGAAEESGEAYLLKPMNCPHHIRIYACEPRSYRDLPFRLAEFGTVYRYEQSGELSGLTRVRCLTQDDAHIFCTEEQVEAEFRDTVELVLHVLGVLGLTDYRVQISLRDPASEKYAGDPAVWAKAEEALRRTAREMKLPCEERRGEAAFYGPKMDFMVKDCIGREWQLGTVQLDYVLPERFKLEYTARDNTKRRPVMIHRAPFGSFERFTAILIEHFAGAFPPWLAPVQARTMNITDKQEAAARAAAATLREAGIRADVDLGSEKINAKIAAAETEKIPYVLVLGAREAEAGTVSVRGHGGRQLGVRPLAEFSEWLRKKITQRAAD